MKKYIYALLFTMGLGGITTSCEDVLDRPAWTDYTDENYWTSENDFRLYFNYYYPYYFVGYNSSYTTTYAPLRGYTFDDDRTGTGPQTNFTSVVPGDNGSYSLTTWAGAEYGGQTWDFSWVRRTNVIIERLERSKDLLGSEVYSHWMAVARFFRAWEYHRLVKTFGDVPYWDVPVNEADLKDMYKNRDSRSTVTNAIYEDLKYALANVRTDDGKLNINKDIVAAVTSNIMLFEGTWQHYHKGNSLEASAGLNDENAKKYLQLCMDAAEVVMNSGKYSFGSDYKSLFGSEDLAGNPEVILYRSYIAGVATHCIASYSNGDETVGVDANLDLLRAYICNDGKPYQASAVENADNFSMQELCRTRDPRFEATFFKNPDKDATTRAYTHKFIDREGIAYYEEGNVADRPDKYESNTNTNDAPVLRLAESALNWIEAKAVLAEMGGTAVTQADVDRTINAIRDRPLDETAIAYGVQKTAPLDINAIAEDPARDADVSPLMWEIRRERRMEFTFEGQRMDDIRRWYKLNYMDNNAKPATLRGPWVDYTADADLKSQLAEVNIGILKVEKADGTVVTYDGTNDAEMVGYCVPTNVAARNAFSDKNYLRPIGSDIIKNYSDKAGTTLTQTGGW